VRRKASRGGGAENAQQAITTVIGTRASFQPQWVLEVALDVTHRLVFSLNSR